MKCRHCAQPVELSFIDLGAAPPSNSYLTTANLAKPETWYPLKVMVCTHCWLVQTQDYADRSEFFSGEYAYFSSFSTTWLEHARRYVGEMADRFKLGSQSLVVEVASNDGYLLQYVKERAIPCLGIEPTHSTAAAAREKGIEVVEEFFGTVLAQKLVALGTRADLMAANNVLAHVPDINDFVAGFATLIKPHGVVTFEFPHLLRLVQECQFDTIYHEHYSYLSLTSVAAVLRDQGLEVFDVQTLSVHGGSLRVFAQHQIGGAHAVSPAVQAMLALESQSGVSSADFYTGFQSRVNQVKDGLLRFLLDANKEGKRVVGYGAAAKGNTLMNYAGIRPDLISWVVDRNPSKAGRFMPGSRIAIVHEQRLTEERPDYVLILPWNLKSEITQQLHYIRGWGGKFVTAVPTLSVE